MSVCAAILTNQQALFDLLIVGGFDLEEPLFHDHKGWKNWYPMRAAVNVYKTNPHYLNVLVDKKVPWDSTKSHLNKENTWVSLTAYVIDRKLYDVVPFLLSKGIRFSVDQIFKLIEAGAIPTADIDTLLSVDDITDELIKRYILEGKADLATKLVEIKIGKTKPMTSTFAIKIADNINLVAELMKDPGFVTVGCENNEYTIIVRGTFEAMNELKTKTGVVSVVEQ